MNKFTRQHTLITVIALLAYGNMITASGSFPANNSMDALPTDHFISEVSGKSVTPAMIQADIQEKGNPFGITVEPVELSRGVRVKSVQENSLGAQIGLQAGDIITSLNGEMIFNTEKFQEVASQLPSGRDIEINVQRGADRVTAQFHLKAE